MKTKPMIIGKDGDPEYAVLPWPEYQALVAAAEDSIDRAALDEIDADPREEDLPEALVHRIVGGENPTRVWREHRGMKGTELAAAAGIAQSYLSQIEGGKRQGSIGALSAIAAALGVTLDDIAPAPAPAPEV